MNTVDLVLEGAVAQKAAEEGVAVAVAHTTPKLIAKFVALPVLGKVAVCGLGGAALAAAGFGIYKGVKFVKGKFFSKKEEAQTEAPAEEVKAETTEPKAE